MTTYRVTASYETDGQILSASQAEVLGDAWGMLYPSREAAEEMAQDLQESLADYGLHPSTTYSVEESTEGRLPEAYIRKVIAAVECAPGVIHDGSDSIGVIVREALGADPRATVAGIAAIVVAAQDDAAAEREHEARTDAEDCDAPA